MAEVASAPIPTQTNGVKSTPTVTAPVQANGVKSAPSVKTEEVKPEETKVEAQGKFVDDPPFPTVKPGSKDDVPVTILPYPIHPAPPSGKLLDDVTTHVQCQSWFVQNVKELIVQYKALQKASDEKDQIIKTLSSDLNKVQEDLNVAVEDRDEYRDNLIRERNDHATTRSTLIRVKDELSQLQINFDTVSEKHRQAASELREAKNENKQLRREVNQKNLRIKDLEDKLKQSNDSEDKANEVVTQLQHYIYQLEQRKSVVEREKDEAQKQVRMLNDELAELKRQRQGRMRISIEKETK